MPDIIDGEFEDLSPSSPNLPSKQVKRELNALQYPAIFESVLDEIISNSDIKRYLSSRNVHYPKFMQWVFKDDDRRKRWDEAKEILTELQALEVYSIADSLAFSPNDLIKQKLQIDTRLKMAEQLNKSYNKKAKPTDTKNMTEQLKLAQSRIDSFNIKTKEKAPTSGA